jgi:PKD repeat protein
MGRSKRRRALNVVLSTMVAALVVVPAGASAFADRGAGAESASGPTVDAGEALQRAADEVSPEPVHDHSSHEHTPVSTENSIAAAAEDAVNDGADLARASTLPTGFADVEVMGDISDATSVAFVPDGKPYAGTAFVALKTGVIKSFDYNTTTKMFEPKVSSTTFADLSRQVNDYWDRGLTGIALDPQFGASGNAHNFVYVNYAYNHDPRVAETDVPHWGDPSSAYDVCPEGQEASVGPPPITGCLATVRITRLKAVMDTDGWVMEPGSETPLLMGACQQFGSHASGDVVFGPDGYLYASAGDGASFTTEDYGQANNPCPGDPANGVEGGSLRSQDYQTSGDPLGFGGAIVRMNAVNGKAPDGTTDMAKRMVAYGQRNPWRMSFRPGTTELWSGDVGAGLWEEINRVDVSTVSTVTPAPVNRGWPCYEGAAGGSARQPGWDALNKPICENLYGQGLGVVAAPYFSYHSRGDLLTPNEDCLNDTSANSGVEFGSTSSNYPAAYKGALFFSDFARSCIWMLGKNTDGTPDPNTIRPFVQSAETPVDLTVGPGGDLFYVDYGLNDQGVPTENEAGVHRIVYTGTNGTPTAKITANKTSGPSPLAVTFSGLSSTDPDSDTLTYAWDLDADGQYDDSTSPTPSKSYTTGTYNVGLRVDDQHGHTATTTQQIQSGNDAPVLGSVTPASSLTWVVGQSIPFSASATDTQQGNLPASAFTWQLAIRHCPGGVCHTHSLQTYSGVKSGSFSAPDHEYPSHLLLTVKATDSGGLTDTRTIQLDPKTVALTFASTPAGATVTLNGADHVTPYTETFIQGSQFNLTAAETMSSGGSTSSFVSWSDGLARTHSMTAPTSPTTVTALYTAAPVIRLSTYPEGAWYVGQTLGFDAAVTGPQQEWPDSAYSFAMERQDCDSGCPRVVVQRWTGVRTGKFVVPTMPYPSHLYLTATATDARGATVSRSLQIDPRRVSLSVQTRPGKLKVGVDGVNRKSGWSSLLVAGSTVRLVAPRHQAKHGVRYVFVKWTDGGARKHDIVVWDSAVTVKAVYRRVR